MMSVAITVTIEMYNVPYANIMLETERNAS